MKKVYVPMIADLLHAGHMNILKEAAKFGDVTVGLFTDKAAGEIDDVPYLSFEKGKDVLENIKFVTDVIAQETASFKSNRVLPKTIKVISIVKNIKTGAP